MRIAVAEIGQETDSFSSLVTGLDSFEQYGLYLGDEILEKMPGVGMIGGFLEVAKSEPDAELIPIIRAWAGAGAIISTETLEFFEDKLVNGIKDALPLDGIFLALHGAASAQKDDDLEGYLLSALRRAVGPDIPIVSPLDHHANITKRMIDHLDLFVAFRSQPHDHVETGVLAAKHLFAQVKDEIRPTVGWRKIPMITPQDQFLTSQRPMKVWFDLAREMETRPGVLAASPIPMQPWLDVKEGGWTAVVYTENDAELAQSLADELANKAWEMREQFWVMDLTPPGDAVREAVEGEGLVILSDTGDSVYGGAPGDSTCLLVEMVKQKITCTALVPIVDPEAVDIAIKTGIGNQVTLAVGGKWDHVFSQPAEITGQVTAISLGFQAWLQDRGFSDLGRTALIEVEGVKLVLLEKRSFAINQPILYTHLGLDVNEAQMVVVKTASNFQFFAPWRKQMIRVDSPGTTQSNLHAFEWKYLPRPIYPLDELAEWKAGG
ncbi:MAG: M81 family metallopeptidase [Candidatus Latescibacteria bacterium]|nr:M81 family metallopeptidase [Candidatus Latescibacterota bacterium]